MKTRRGGISIGVLVMLCLLGAGLVFGIMQYNKHKEQKAAELQRQQEEERVRAEKEEAERKAEQERIRKEREEQEAKRRREREEREARQERERQERLQREREAEEARRKAAAVEAAKENYRRASNAFCGGTTMFLSDEALQELRLTSAPLWYVDETFTDDKRICEIKGGSAVILRSDGTTEEVRGASPMASLDTKPGLLAFGKKVWICGASVDVKTFDVPAKSKAIVPFDGELGGLLDVALTLGVNPPETRYQIALKPKGGGKALVLGTFAATDSVSRKDMEDAVRSDLDRRLRRSGRSASAAAVQDYLGVCEVVVKRGVKEEEEEPKRDERMAKEKKCYKCHGKGVVLQRVREDCDECGGKGVIETEVELKDTKHTTDGYWNYRHVGTKKSISRRTCQKCRRSGTVSVEKEVECPVCHGTGTR